MTGLQTMRNELVRVQQAQVECVSDSGYVKSCHKYRYQELTQIASELKTSINWLSKMYEN